jgi:hypothetical protein
MCSDELQCAQEITVFPLMCEPHVTIKYTEQHAIPCIAGEGKGLNTAAGLSSTVCEKLKGNGEIIPAIKDNNGTIIMDCTEKLTYFYCNIMYSYYNVCSVLYILF